MEESILTSAADNEQPQQISQDANTNSNATLNQVAEQEQQSGETKETDADVKAVESAEVEPEFVEPDVDYKGLNREQLVEAMRGLLDSEVQTIKHRVSGLRQCFSDLTKEAENEAYEAYLAAGGDKATYQRVEDSLSVEFRKLYETYRNRRQQYLDAIEERKKRNLEAKRQTLEELRQLLESNEEIKVIYDHFNEIQERWKTIGDVPREELNDLWQNYHFLVEQFFSKVNMAKELRMLDLKRNLEQKIQLCEKAESLILEESLNKAFKEVQQLREQWREIGPVPSQNNEEIWSRFCNALDQVEARRREYYEQRKAEMDKNLLAKQALLEQVETLTATMPDTIKSWNSVSDELNKLLDLWKSIGAVPHEINEEIWGKFKGRIDQFYAAKKAYLNQMHDEQTENYNRKIDLCLKAEAIANRDDWKRATDELLQLQAEWKTIGPVNRKVSDKIWQRFRGACDVFFERKGAYFKDLRGSEAENLAKKEAIIAQIKAFEFGESKDENLAVIKDFQRQWMEIGHVPMSEKDRIQQEFRSTINAHFEKLKISVREAEENAFRERVRQGGDDHRFVNNEKQALQDKIDKMRSDIKLWENNLGFFSNSRSADLLKQEFDKKMQHTRQQIALLEAKLKILNEAERAEKNAQTPDAK